MRTIPSTKTISKKSVSPNHFYDPVMDFLDLGDFVEEVKGTGTRETAAFYAMMQDRIKHSDQKTNKLYQKVIEVMRHLDVDGNGEIDEEEYVTAAMKNPEILDVFRYVLFGGDDQTDGISSTMHGNRRRRSGILHSESSMRGRVLARGGSFSLGSSGKLPLKRMGSFNMNSRIQSNGQSFTGSDIGPDGGKDKEFSALTKLNQVMNFQMLPRAGAKPSTNSSRPSQNNIEEQTQQGDSFDLAGSVAEYNAMKKGGVATTALDAARLIAANAAKANYSSDSKTTTQRKDSKISKHASFDLGDLIQTAIVESGSDSSSSSDSDSDDDD
jgi:hypothetical protein